MGVVEVLVFSIMLMMSWNFDSRYVYPYAFSTFSRRRSNYRIGSTQVEMVQYIEVTSWNYFPAAEAYYYGFGYTIASVGRMISIEVEFTQGKRHSKRRRCE